MKFWLALEPHSEGSCVVPFELCDVREKRNRKIVGSSANTGCISMMLRWGIGWNGVGATQNTSAWAWYIYSCGSIDATCVAQMPLEMQQCCTMSSVFSRVHLFFCMLLYFQCGGHVFVFDGSSCGMGTALLAFFFQSAV